ncbi:MAG TPA: type II toxin-antitoxin system VapC family toxin [Candidatus Saccharimonadales bacterium]|jgi:hypothetical protein|nr:type II toxin-antitoxin system VapC family toxin [Candidatus Saccharimonadales bacterium]
MILIDTNLLVYASQDVLNIEVLLRERVGYSSVTKIEALGYPQLPVSELGLLEQLFEEYKHFPLTEEVIDQAVSLKQLRKMKLGDSIIAATALVNDLELWTNNIKDFQHIDGLKTHNPVSSES